MKRMITMVLLVVASTGFAAEPAATATVTVDVSTELGPVKPMNAVNGGPYVGTVRGDQKTANFDDFAGARIPFSRTHDCVNGVSGGAHACDIGVIFPDFDADENDPRNYDFVFTDRYLDSIRRTGTEVFFRLGPTIEHGPKKYGILPPKDYLKWARVCEHVIRHYNEGWGWGLDTARTTHNTVWSNQFDIAYWEIWNEPDLDSFDDVEKNVYPRMWAGTVTNFFEFFEVSAMHLKSKFPELKIGGPAICGREEWAERFLDYCEKRHVPLDFFSWHIYARTSKSIAEKATRIRRMLDLHGYDRSESILNEWNFVKGWGDDFVYSKRVIAGDLNLKGAAFVANTMVACQCAPVDMLMYYDARPASSYNTLFAPITLWPLKGYYPFYIWSRLAALGTQVSCSVTDGRGIDIQATSGNVEQKDVAIFGSFSAIAAKGASGHGAVLIVRYSEDDNTSDVGLVTIHVRNVCLDNARCYMTDLVRVNTDIPVSHNEDGSIRIAMHPNSFVLLEY